MHVILITVWLPWHEDYEEPPTPPLRELFRVHYHQTLIPSLHRLAKASLNLRHSIDWRKWRGSMVTNQNWLHAAETQDFGAGVRLRLQNFVDAPV